MEIIDKSITLQNLKGQKSMSSTSKTQAWEKNSFNVEEFIKSLQAFSTVDLELLIDWYTLFDDPMFNEQIEAIKHYLYLRNSSLGKELL
jgi:hypothetical protein